MSNHLRPRNPSDYQYSVESLKYLPKAHRMAADIDFAVNGFFDWRSRKSLVLTVGFCYMKAEIDLLRCYAW